MTETAQLFGPDRNLVGVITTPEGPRQSLAILILTSGVVHRVGPHRLGVKIARHLARLGFASMRFDVSGVGDSRFPREASVFRVQDARDSVSAMDLLEREMGISQFALFGICSGAVNAYTTANNDPRVIAAFMLDGFIYPTTKGRVIYYLKKLRALGMAKALLLAVGRLQKKLFSQSGLQRSAPATLSKQERNPTVDEFAHAIQSLTDRGVQVTLMYTGSVLHEYSYSGQLQDTFRKFRFPEVVNCHFAPDMDHTATSLVAQRRLLDLVTEWVQHAATDQLSAEPMNPEKCPGASVGVQS